MKTKYAIGDLVVPFKFDSSEFTVWKVKSVEVRKDAPNVYTLEAPHYGAIFAYEDNMCKTNRTLDSNWTPEKAECLAV